MTPAGGVKPILAESPEDRRGRIREMFGRISSRYDLLNTLLSFGQDRRWRKKALRQLGLRAGDVLVDLAAGTGDVAIAATRLQPQLGAALALDFSEPMLRLAKYKFLKKKRTAIVPVAADAVALPLQDGCADAITIAFGIRNVVDVPAALAEMERILRPAGRLLILEFATPEGRLFGPLFRWYFTRVMPRLGGIVSGSRAAYEYLPQSVGEFHSPTEMGALLEQAGFINIRTRDFSFGVVVAYFGEKKA
jgi:demethylmenaquinone methyltransferase/2-methoxy-6-polyprenyl-1,4-benzoquinol methylase